MNIDKQAMAYAFKHRAETKYMNELVGYFEEMAKFFANHFKISSWHRDDFISEAKIYAYKAIPKYDVKKKSTPFSYFYKIFYIGFLYLMRKENMRVKNGPHICSYDAFSNSVNEDNEMEFPRSSEESHFVIEGKSYEKDRVAAALKEAKRLAKKGVPARDIEDELVKMIVKNMKKRGCRV